MNKESPDKTLILMVGFPRSGKSTKAMSLGHPVVNPDSIRIAIHGRSYVPEAEGLVWCLARYQVHSLFNAGHHTVVFDACNISRKRRDQWENPRWRRQFLISPVDAYECKQRASEIKEYTFRVQLEEAIDRMCLSWEEVTEDEGEILPWPDDCN
jgi:predicted kinase